MEKRAKRLQQQDNPRKHAIFLPKFDNVVTSSAFSAPAKSSGYVLGTSDILSNLLVARLQELSECLSRLVWLSFIDQRLPRKVFKANTMKWNADDTRHCL